jgi:hypothetical protein
MSSDAPPPQAQSRAFPFPAGLSGLAATDAVKAAQPRLHKSAPPVAWAHQRSTPFRRFGANKPLCGTREELGAAKVACKALSNDLDAAKAVLAEAECATSEATVPVMLEEADQIATY